MQVAWYGEPDAIANVIHYAKFFSRSHDAVICVHDALPFGGLWYVGQNAVNHAIGYAKFFSRSNGAVIRVCDEAGNVIETHEQKGEFEDW